MLFKALKKAAAGTIIISLVLESIFFVIPQKAQAALPTVDAGNIVQSTITAFNTTASSIADYSLNYKETILDPIAYFIAKTLLQQLTSSIVDWINSGFDGSPSFVTDPGGFFLNIVDEEIGKFIAGSEDLKFLCSPFSIDLRIMLAFRYRPFKRQVACTLSDVIKNVKGAANGASINGFTAGDFKQGGWPAFVSMTTEPQNNVYGAFLEADSEIALRIGDKSVKQKDELNWGKGFLSWKKCRPGSTHTEGADEGSGEGGTDAGNYTNGTDVGYNNQVCDIQTPGSVIESQINQALPSGMRSLELADEFNEIVNALFAQLVKVALTGGLRSVSGGGASGTDYLKQLEQEQQKNNATVTQAQSTIYSGIDAALATIDQVKQERSKSLDLVIGAKKAIQDVQMCYRSKVDGSNGVTASPERRAAAEAKINTYENYINTNITPLAEPHLNALRNFDSLINKLTLLKTQAQYARTANDINPISAEYSKLYPTFPTQIDIQKAKTDGDTTIEKLDYLKTSNVREQGLRECSFF